MKIFVLLACFLFASGNCFSQNKKLDSLDKLIASAKSDTQRINLSIEKMLLLNNINLDSGVAFGNRIIADAKRIHYLKGEARARIGVAVDYCFKGRYDSAKLYLDATRIILQQTSDSIALARMYNAYGTMYGMQSKFEEGSDYYAKAAEIAQQVGDIKLLGTIYQNTAIGYQQQSNYPKALEYFQKAMDAAEKKNDERGMAYIYINLAITYNSLDDNKRAEENYKKAIESGKKLNLKNVEAYAYANLASLYADLKKYDQEYDYSMKAAALGAQMGDDGIQASSLSRASMALAHQNKYDQAESLNKQARQIADASRQPFNIYQAYTNMGMIYTMQKAYKKAIPFFEKSFHQLKDADIYTADVGAAYAQLSECYEKTGNYIKALSAYKISAKIADSVRGKENIKKATELSMNYDFEKKQQLQQAAQEKKDAVSERQRTRQYFIIAILLLLILAAIVITIIQIRSNKQKYKANLLLTRQKLKVENALADLKSAQAQLIQSEKMASLGELTAGIAHEIQNPLNFVNNFSELNREMIVEASEELNKQNIEGVRTILNDIKDNSEKINHHGKRADSIVKGMLQHSRSSTGKKEPADINGLCDEYLRLSYHGLRAKDKTFNAAIHTDFDETIDKINVVSQDMGRVLLNLFNNAFYAVNEKNKNLDGFAPEVKVITQKLNDRIRITVADNGNGIPDNIKDKVFQPFFTTKPTGSGTGLGLSLSYDIVKAHGGEINIESEKGKGTAFIIELPI